MCNLFDYSAELKDYSAELKDYSAELRANSAELGANSAELGANYPKRFILSDGKLSYLSNGRKDVRSRRMNCISQRIHSGLAEKLVEKL